MRAMIRQSFYRRTVQCGVIAIAVLGAAGCRPRQAPATGQAKAGPEQAAPQVAPLPKDLARPEPIAISPPLPGFSRGINLGNCLDAPSEGAWGTRISEEHFEMAARAGLDHVRLPVRFTTPERSDSQPPHTIRPEFFARVDWALDRAAAHGLSIILDVHHFEEIHKEPQAQKQRLYALWRQISERYAGRPSQVAFEILNEPNGALEPAIVNEITAEALRIIREKNPTRIVFANCYFWANAERLHELVLPADDPNVVAQFHMYQPILFTHQGAPWMEPFYQTRGVIFPGPPHAPTTPVNASGQSWVLDWFRAYDTLPFAQNPSGPRAVFEHFDHAARYVKATGKRVYLGEFGAIDVADPQSRANYVWLVRTEAERRGIGWALWDDGGKFKAMDAQQGTWNRSLHGALFEN
jgi:endoglucanase